MEKIRVSLSLNFIQKVKDELKKSVYYLNELHNNTFDMDRAEYLRNEIIRLNFVLSQLRLITSNPQNYM